MSRRFRKYDEFRHAADLYFALFPNEKRFSGGSRVASKIYPHLQKLYNEGLTDGAMADEAERKRIIKRWERSLRKGKA